MPAPTETLWPIEEHTKAKHEILRRYLGAWFVILGSKIPRILYLDGFCGPGRYAGGEPGSPLIALNEARANSYRLQGTEIAFLFIDSRKDRIEHLEALINSMALPSNFIPISRVGEFEDQVAGIFADLDSNENRLAPTFAFIDPFGWSGLPFKLVGRLLSNPRSEVFINIMVDSINRFVEHPNVTDRKHIRDLFGADEAEMEAVLSSGDRISALRQFYQVQLQKYARFVRYFEMRNNNNRVIYYLFFAGNHPLGHLRMKEAFWRVDPDNGYRFSDGTDPNQLVLLEEDPSLTLATKLKSQFNGTKQLSQDVIKFVEDETPYITRHAKSALRHLQKDRSINVSDTKADGTRRTHGFPDDVVIQF